MGATSRIVIGKTMRHVEAVIHGKEFRDSYLSLMATRFPAAAVERKRRAWDWLFANPCSTSDHPTRVCCIETAGTTAGAYILMPTRYVIDGEENSAAHPIATAVHPDHAGVGPMMLHAQLRVESSLAIGVPNRHRLSKAYTRYGGLVGPPRILRRRIHRPGSFLAARGKAPAGAGSVLDALARLPVAITGLGKAAPRQNERVEPIPDFGREFDDAWTRAAPTVALAQSRSSAFLSWRYVDMPLNSYESHALRRDGALEGYVVTTVQDTADGPVGRIADIFAYRGAVRDYALLLASADTRLRDAGCILTEISYAPSPSIDAAARSLGFLMRKEGLPLVMRHDLPAMNAKLPDLIDRVHFCRGDHDEDY